MSVSSIPDRIKYRLWARSAGRCYYCNEPLWEDLMTKKQYNKAYIAHIYGEKPDSARYHPTLSEELKQDFSNLMLLCDAHHTLIDRVDIEGHPVDVLMKMKRDHEERIALQTTLSYNHRSHIVHYIARISDQTPIVTFEQSQDAMSPTHYPAEDHPIEIGLKNSAFSDAEDHFWIIERENLRRQYRSKIGSRRGNDIKHLSIFAIAPQPLLIELGHLLTDISGISVYQHQKEPLDNWKWSNIDNGIDFYLNQPSTEGKNIAVNLSLSASISNKRITSVLGEDTSIWTLTIDNPNNDFLKTREQLKSFREKFRSLLNMIKYIYGENNIIHIFPAVPVAIAVEIGRIWSHKADLPMRIYDQNTKAGGFIHAFDITSGNEE